MQPSILQAILTSRFSAADTSGVYSVDPDRRLVVLAQHDSGVLQLPKVTALEFHDDFIAVTSDDSCYFIPPHSVFALKSSAEKSEAEEGRPGFRRP